MTSFSLTQDEIDEQIKLLAADRQTLAYDLRRQALLGAAHTPPEVSNGIDEARAQIRQIKAALRASGVVVADAPGDEETLSTVVVLSETEQRNRARMLQKMRAIWVTGLLERSLADEMRIALDLVEGLGAVDLPLNAQVQELRQPPRPQERGTAISAGGNER